MVEKTKTSFTLSRKTLKNFKIYCIERDVSMSEEMDKILERFMDEQVE